MRLPPEKQDVGWVTDSAPRFSVAHDKVGREVAVAFGARSRLLTPAGADMMLEELCTARVKPARPDGAALLARINVSLRMPAGEQVDVSVRSTSSRQASVVEANVTMDGATLLNQSWTGSGAALEAV